MPIAARDRTIRASVEMLLDFASVIPMYDYHLILSWTATLSLLRHVELQSPLARHQGLP